MTAADEEAERKQQEIGYGMPQMSLDGIELWTFGLCDMHFNHLAKAFKPKSCNFLSVENGRSATVYRSIGILWFCVTRCRFELILTL